MNTPQGVMQASYADDRVTKPHLKFRLHSRALVAAQAFRRFGSGAGRPRILDLGSADGRTMVETHRLLDAEESLGIEYTQGLIDRAGALPDNVRLCQGDATKLPEMVASGRYDLVTALAILEHLEAPEKMMREAARALAPGGVIVASCPDPRWDVISGSAGLHQEEHHERRVDRQAFERFAREGGLQPVHCERFMFVLVAFLPYLRIPVSAAFAYRADRFLGRLRVPDAFFVNQLFVARKG